MNGPRPKRLQDSGYFQGQATICKPRRMESSFWIEEQSLFLAGEQMESLKSSIAKQSALIIITSDNVKPKVLAPCMRKRFSTEASGISLKEFVARIGTRYRLDEIDEVFSDMSCCPKLPKTKSLFGALCYPTNDSEDLGKFQAKADIGIFVGYAPSRKGYRIYNKRTRRLMETIHVTFDEMHQSMAPVRMSSGPEPFIMTPGQLKSGLAPTDKELEMLFQPMFDEHLEQSRVNEPVPSATEINAQVVPPGTSLSTTIAQDAPSTSASSSTSDIHHPVQHQEIAEEPTHEDTPINHDVLHPSHNLVTGDPGSAQSSSGNVNSAEPNQVNYPYPPDHLRDDQRSSLDNIVDNPSSSFARIEAIQNLHCNAANQHMIISSMDSQTAFAEWNLSDLVDTPDGGSFELVEDLMGIPMRIMRDVKIQEEVRREVLSFLEIDWLAGHLRSKEARQYQLQRLNTSPCLDVERLLGSSDKTQDSSSAYAVGNRHSTNVDRAELLWERFTQGIQNFYHTKQATSQLKRYPKISRVILSSFLIGRVFKVQISSLSLKVRSQFEVFGNGNFRSLITESIHNHRIYPKYLEMVVENTKKTPQESASMQPATKHATTKKPSTTTPVKQSKPAPPPTKKPSKRKLPQKVRKGKPIFQLVDEDDDSST
ncbi:retrovirus-related pol polyprotein from transposon TNT 1-94 [Tanacetum coccineum]|uniref:Retrovirus-related pol polyprotein from transposon TNT 1-94 n=1 Tax=Tanacetum coccineum TaxID=301880 RepID=A0ABQ5HED5_9ASTR